jgi:hypothetical protein
MGPLPPVNLILRVYNQTQAAGSLRWQATSPPAQSAPPNSGGATVPPCQEFDTALGPGNWEITIAGQGGSLTATVSTSSSGQARQAYAIRADGRVERLYAVVGEPEPSGPPLC